ncbi:LysR family transcriptional regulator [Sphingopyxis fribergensis]|uniref:LysR family transcriptional regulator n=1 Tax=Sphingopyxis fribergensis TaxID=1515612 RepID=A0A0A7PNJ7_9SPHN|nr:LysR family transcriptional regulator [Sphingopyxis fribergensis]AJA09492.1 LysR family transcriptional regulator [Sphingopyxis fribergensis]
MSLGDRLSSIAVFIEVARSGSFTTAANRLGLTKSAVSKSVGRLEERLGVKLIYRSTRSLSLTSDGEAFFARCSVAFDEIADAETNLSELKIGPRGRLRIDMPAMYGRKIILPLLLEVAKSHPDLHLSTTFRDWVINPVEEGVDLVLRFGDLKDTTGLISRKLVEQRFYFCASPDYIQRRGAPLSWEEIKDHECVVSYRNGAPHSWVVVNESGETIRFIPPPTHEMGDGDAMLAAAVAGCGILHMPEALVRPSLESGELVPLLQHLTPARGSLYAVWPTTRSLMPKIRFVVDALVNAARVGRLG